MKAPRRCATCKTTLEQQPSGRHRRYCSDACKQAGYRRRRRHNQFWWNLSASDNWTTPPDLFARLNARYGPFTLDPCATAENTTCPNYFTFDQDGLAQRWTGRVFCNPPYGRRQTGAWLKKAYESVQAGDCEIAVLLIPSRTSTRAWHDYVTKGEFEFLDRRLRFGNCDGGAPFDSAVVVFRNTNGVTK
jgi:site-specific DNA-methyltransferase (adenine-specific)